VSERRRAQGAGHRAQDTGHRADTGELNQQKAPLRESLPRFGGGLGVG